MKIVNVIRASVDTDEAIQTIADQIEAALLAAPWASEVSVTIASTRATVYVEASASAAIAVRRIIQANGGVILDA